MNSSPRQVKDEKVSIPTNLTKRRRDYHLPDEISEEDTDYWGGGYHRGFYNEPVIYDFRGDSGDFD